MTHEPDEDDRLDPYDFATQDGEPLPSPIRTVELPRYPAGVVCVLTSGTEHKPSCPSGNPPACECDA